MMFPRFHGGHADEESEVRRRLVFSISLCERPAYQWMKISVTSVTSNVLLAKLTPRPANQRTGADFRLRGPTPSATRWGIT